MYQQTEVEATPILDAALEHLETFGLRRLTMEEVARRAGVSRVTLYRRFQSKDALIQAVVLREVQRFFALLEETVEPHATVDDRVTEGFAFTLDYLRSHSLLNRLLRTEPDAVLPIATIGGGPLLATARHNLAALFTKDVTEGRLPPLDVDLLAELLARLVLSFLLTPQSAAPLESAEDARAFARHVLVPIVHAQAKGRRVSDR
ncbi:MAG TPA: QsdR family transcriptional regulator [Actinomycetota bacterium]|jgi:AcrR family transcriptional regulator|nr:QsdR family transcriptional regulator [Actinomycetota bacterium]